MSNNFKKGGSCRGQRMGPRKGKGHYYHQQQTIGDIVNASKEKTKKYRGVIECI